MYYKNSYRTLKDISSGRCTSIDGRYPSGLLSVAYPGARGKAGDITIQTGELLVSNGAKVSAKTFRIRVKIISLHYIFSEVF